MPKKFEKVPRPRGRAPNRGNDEFLQAGSKRTRSSSQNVKETVSRPTENSSPRPKTQKSRQNMTAGTSMEKIDKCN